jgi:hypothetical protein
MLFFHPAIFTDMAGFVKTFTLLCLRSNSGSVGMKLAIVNGKENTHKRQG